MTKPMPQHIGIDDRIVSGLSTNPILRRSRKRRIAPSDKSLNQPSCQSQEERRENSSTGHTLVLDCSDLALCEFLTGVRATAADKPCFSSSPSDPKVAFRFRCVAWTLTW